MVLHIVDLIVFGLFHIPHIKVIGTKLLSTNPPHIPNSNPILMFKLVDENIELKSCCELLVTN